MFVGSGVNLPRFVQWCGVVRRVWGLFSVGAWAVGCGGKAG